MNRADRIRRKLLDEGRDDDLNAQWILQVIELLGVDHAELAFMASASNEYPAELLDEAVKHIRQLVGEGLAEVGSFAYADETDRNTLTGEIADVAKVRERMDELKAAEPPKFVPWPERGEALASRVRRSMPRARKEAATNWDLWLVLTDAGRREANRASGPT